MPVRVPDARSSLSAERQSELGLKLESAKIGRGNHPYRCIHGSQLIIKIDENQPVALNPALGRLLGTQTIYV